MALVLKDRVQQTGTANTTVSFTLSGSVAGYQTFSVVGDTNTTYYAATDGSGNWEAGLGTYSTTGPTLTRTTILSSSNSGSAVTFSGTVNVFLTYPSSRALYLDGASAAINVSQAAFTTNGIPYASSTSALSTGSALTFNGTNLSTTGSFVSTVATGTAPLTVSSTTQVANLNAATSGAATNISSGTTGAVPYQSAASTTAFLNGNTSTTPQFVTSTGTGSVAQAPTLTSSTGSGSVVLATSPTLVTPALGTPSALVGTNITGTASGLSIGGNSATATNVASGTTGAVPYQSAASTTAFLSGNTTTTPQFVTSTGTGSVAQAPTLTSSTGSGSVVLSTSPSLTTPTLGVASATTVNKVTLTAPATGSTLTIADGKTLTASNSITLAGTDSTTMTFPPASASVGYLNVPINSQSAAYTTVLADSGKAILHPSGDANARTFTIDSNANVAYALGTAITFINMTSQVVTIAITSDTMYLAGTGTTGSRSLAQYGMATAIKMTTTTWLISGNGLT
jgi:hypothetical protein